MANPDLTRVTPHLFDAYDRSCPRWLHLEHAGVDKTNQGEFHRWDIRVPLLARAKQAHRTLRRPTEDDFTPPHLPEPEHRALFARAAASYLRYFGDQPGRFIDHPAMNNEATESPSRGVQIGGAVDLLLEDEKGDLELRQFELWRRALPDDPLDATEVRFAVLRLARRLAGKKLLISRVDLLADRLTQRTIDIDAELPELRSWFDGRLAELRTIAEAPDPEPRPGSQCGRCGYVPGCPAHALHAARVQKPGIVVITPSLSDNWSRCKRLYHLSHQLDVPASDPDAGLTGTGLAVHDLLCRLHTRGTCDPATGDPATGDPAVDINALIADYPDQDPDELRGYIERHHRRCPLGSDALGHEYEVARVSPFATEPWFLATARIDAIWIHDGLLDARDYKTGRLMEEPVGNSLAARIQAFVLAPIAETRGLRLRIRHEYLGADVEDDPESFEPDEEQLAAIANELHTIAGDIRKEQDFTGVSDLAICSRCKYRSICRDASV